MQIEEGVIRPRTPSSICIIRHIIQRPHHTISNLLPLVTIILNSVYLANMPVLASGSTDLLSIGSLLKCFVFNRKLVKRIC